MNHKEIRKKLHDRLNIIEPIPKKNLSIASILRTEWCKEFIKHMRDKMLIGAFRYGRVRETAKTRDYVHGMRQRIKLYVETGNTEFLVDVANFAMVEFMISDHPKKHFKDTDDVVHLKEK